MRRRHHPTQAKAALLDRRATDVLLPFGLVGLATAVAMLLVQIV